MTQNQEFPTNRPSRANISLINDDAVLLHKLREILQKKHPVRISLTDVVHVALEKLYQLETTV